jgi:hypothetical protein
MYSDLSTYSHMYIACQLLSAVATALILQCVSLGNNCTAGEVQGTPPDSFSTLPSPNNATYWVAYTGLSPATTYSWFVLSNNSAAPEGVCSSAVQMTTLPYAPRAASALAGSLGSPPQTQLLFTGFTPGAAGAPYGAATTSTIKVGWSSLHSYRHHVSPSTSSSLRFAVCVNAQTIDSCVAIFCALCTECAHNKQGWQL